MGNKWNKNYIRVGIVFTVAVCICITYSEIIKQWRLIAGIFGKIISAMAPIFVGIVLAFLLNPIMIYIRRGITHVFSTKLKKGSYDEVYSKTKVPSLILTVVLFIAAIAGFLWLIIPQIYVSLTDLVAKTPEYVNDAKESISKIFANHKSLEGKLSSVIDYFQNNVMSIVEDTIMPNIDTIAIKVSSGVILGVKAVLNFFLGLIVMIYLLASKDTLLAQGKKMIYCLFSKKTGNRILEGLSYANSVFGGFINGKILDSIIIGIMCFIFTSIVGMEYAVLISVIVGVTNIIPFFGPFIGAVPGSLLALMDDPIMFVVFIVWILVLQQFDGNILGPLILGDSTGISGIWVLVAILLGGDLFGVPGMVMGVPVFACIYAFFAVQLRDGLRKKNLSSRTADYYRLIGFDEDTGEPVYRAKHEKRKSIRQRKRKATIKKGVGKMTLKKNMAAESEEELKKIDEEEDLFTGIEKAIDDLAGDETLINSDELDATPYTDYVDGKLVKVDKTKNYDKSNKSDNKPTSKKNK